MKSPRLSIIIPIYNAASTLELIITNILSESYKDFELILVNDGSTDTTAAKLASIQKEDSRIVVVNKPNGGPSSARNTGIDTSNGKYVIFFDSDDNIVEGSLQKVIDSIESTKSDLLVSGWRINLQNVIGYKEINPPQETIRGKAIKKYFIRSIGNDGTLYNLWNKVFHLDIIRQHRIYFREDISFGEDLIFTFHYLRYCNQLSLISDPTYQYTIGSATSIFSKSSLVLKYRKLNLIELDDYLGTEYDQELEDITNWVKWRWLLSYWIIISSSLLGYKEKVELIKQSTQSSYIVADNSRYIGIKKLSLENIINVLRYSALLALITARSISLLKKCTVWLKLKLHLIHVQI